MIVDSKAIMNPAQAHLTLLTVTFKIYLLSIDQTATNFFSNS